MHRRLQVVCVVVLLLFLMRTGVFSKEAQQPGPTPNIIVILVDDLDALPQTLTTMPNVQNLLVSQGMSFSNMIAPKALCCPSRASLLTGQYVHNHQVYVNVAPDGGFPKFYESGGEHNTIATYLQNTGYRTAMLGKYFNNYPLPTNPTYVPPGWTEWDVVLHGSYYFSYTMNVNGVLVNYGANPEEYSTDVMAAKADAFIRQSIAGPTPAPFFLEFSSIAAHGPAEAAPRHERLFRNTLLTLAPSFNEKDVRDKPAWVRALPTITADQTSRIHSLYRKRLRSLQAVDDMIGQLVQTLTETGQLNNTYIFFTSDNGFHYGEHRLQTGKGTAYEEAVRLPLIVRGPGVPAGVVRTELVGMIDLAPTFAEIMGLPVADIPTFDGRSILPLLQTDQPVASWRSALLIENPLPSRASIAAMTTVSRADIEAAAAADDDDKDLPSFFALRTAAYKYVEYATGERELYDLTTDPHELQSIHDTASAALISQLSTTLAALKTCVGASCRVADLPVAPATPTPTPTQTPTDTPTATATPTQTPTFTSTPTETPTHTPTGTLTPSPTPTDTPTLPPGVTPSKTPTAPPTPTLPPAVTPSNTPPPAPTATASPTSTAEQPATATPTVTATTAGQSSAQLMIASAVQGAPGSRFVVVGSGFASNSDLSISLTLGDQVSSAPPPVTLGTVTTNGSGVLRFTLMTHAQMSTGAYAVRVEGLSSPSTTVILDASAPLQMPAIEGKTLAVGDQFNQMRSIYLPMVHR